MFSSIFLVLFLKIGVLSNCCSQLHCLKLSNYYCCHIQCKPTFRDIHTTTCSLDEIETVKDKNVNTRKCLVGVSLPLSSSFHRFTVTGYDHHDGG